MSKVNKTRKCPSVQAVTEADPANLPAVRNAQGGRLHGQVLRDPQRRRLLRRRGFSLWAGGKSILRKYLGKVLFFPQKNVFLMLWLVNSKAGVSRWSWSSAAGGFASAHRRTQRWANFWFCYGVLTAFFALITIVPDTMLEMINSLKRFIHYITWIFVFVGYVPRLWRVNQVRHVVCPSGVAVAS